MEKIKPITIEIEKKIWEKFKEVTPRTINLNDAVVRLIAEYVEER